MQQKTKRKKTSAYYIHKATSAFGSIFYLLGRYLWKIVLILALCAGVVYIHKSIKTYEKEDVEAQSTQPEATASAPVVLLHDFQKRPKAERVILPSNEPVRDLKPFMLDEETPFVPIAQEVKKRLHEANTH